MLSWSGHFQSMRFITSKHVPSFIFSNFTQSKVLYRLYLTFRSLFISPWPWFFWSMFKYCINESISIALFKFSIRFYPIPFQNLLMGWLVSSWIWFICSFLNIIHEFALLFWNHMLLRVYKCSVSRCLITLNTPVLSSSFS